MMIRILTERLFATLLLSILVILEPLKAQEEVEDDGYLNDVLGVLGVYETPVAKEQKRKEKRAAEAGKRNKTTKDSTEQDININRVLAPIMDQYYAEKLIADIVRDYSAEQRAEENYIAALDYVTSIYSGHDFYESGFWGVDKPVILPKYEPDYSIYDPVPKTNRTYTPPPESLPPISLKNFYRPVRGGVQTSGFGWRPKFGRMHKGVDISLHIGDTVRAALPGVISGVKYEAKGYGHYVIISHRDGMETRYAHLSRPLVEPGQSVRAGDAIGLGGSTGNSTGPHLHFETRFGGVAVDPNTIYNFKR